MCTSEKAKQTFLQHLPVPVQQVVKLFEVVIILVLHVKNTCTCRFPFKPVVQACDDLKILMHTSKG